MYTNVYKLIIGSISAARPRTILSAADSFASLAGASEPRQELAGATFHSAV